MIGSPHQIQKVFVHLQIADPKGTIKAQLMNFRVACDPTSEIPNSMTPVISAVSCPLCMQTDEYAEIKREQSYSSNADRKAADHIEAEAAKAKSAAVEEQST